MNHSHGKGTDPGAQADGLFTRYCKNEGFGETLPSNAFGEMKREYPVFSTVIGVLILALLVGFGFWMEQRATASDYPSETTSTGTSAEVTARSEVGR